MSTENAPPTHQADVAAAAVIAGHAMNTRRVTHCFVPHEAWTVCMTCYQPWRGPADTGGCTARLLALEVAALTTLLRRLHATADEALRTLDLISRVRAEHVLDDDPEGAWPVVRSDLRGVLEQATATLQDGDRPQGGVGSADTAPPCPGG